jgi:hypothetical protein
MIMGCCLLAAVGSFFPRVALLLMWLFTSYVDRAFSGFLLPLVGLIFLPFTTIMFCLVYSPAAHGVVGVNWIWVLLGLLLDLSSYASGRYGQTQRSTAG